MKQAADEPIISDSAADIVIGNVTAQPGDTVNVDVELRNSTGIAGYLLYIECDTEYVSIVDIADGGATFGGHYEIRETENGYKVLWSNSTNVTKDGIMFTIVAKVADNAPDGVYPITATYSDVNTGTENGETKPITIVDGSITVKKSIPGDLNGDGEVTNMDIIMLARYLVNLESFDDQQLNVADYNGDGAVNNVDLVLMARYVVEAY